jgi:hydroxymethylglutaryl-CoA reductase (NADPH)
MAVPSLLLRQLYTFGSLKNTDQGVKFSIKNRLSDAKFTGMSRVLIDGIDVSMDSIAMEITPGLALRPSDITPNDPIEFPLRQIMDVLALIDPLAQGKHTIEIWFETRPFGKLKLKVDDSITESDDHLVRIPRSNIDNYSEDIVQRRQGFISKQTGVELQHIFQYSFDPHLSQGNIENFTGVAQVPLGFAGPLRVNGEYANGEYLIPLATTEGTLVASYNRGCKLLNLCGGVNSTVIDDAMQRAPVFVLDDARSAREFVKWVNSNMDKIREEAEATSHVAKLIYIDPYLANKFAYLRFNFTTGDAAGQNMVGRATFAACSWMIDNYPGIKHFYLESNFATDKKASQINIMRTRGKRVTAEAVIQRDALIQHMRVEPESLAYHYKVANIGSILSGANNNGAHSANAITAMFIATGQDVANVSESSAGILYTEVTSEGDLYTSITIPSLIVATYGGGTSLPTQRECLEVLGCYGKGKVNRFAEIVAGVVLAGEISLGSAISSSDWVSSHEKYGRNR